MASVVTHEEVSQSRRERLRENGDRTCRTDFLKGNEASSVDYAPTAFLAEASPGHILPTHFHVVDQFQVIYRGDGTLGAHQLSYGAVHFARAYTPYGPICYGKTEGLGFITLRAHYDPGGKDMPENRELLESVADRRPWQISAMPDFALQPGDSGVAMKAIDQLKNESGLAGFSMLMRPGATAYSIDPSRGDGQYILVLRGGILHGGDCKRGLSIIWVDKDEPAFKLAAGPEGAEVMILNFPVPGAFPKQLQKASADSRELKAYQCILCAFVYDEAEGHPDAEVAPGTRWEDVPESFRCPDCNATKTDFQMIEI